MYFVSRRAKDFTGANRDCDLWVILVACGVILLGAVYFLIKRNDDDEQGGGPGSGSVSDSGISSSRGLLDLLSLQDALSSDSDDDFL